MVPGPAPEGGRKVGGIDFGFRNPFAAVWGTADRDGVLWLTGEHYARNKPLSHHAQFLPRDVTWYADPSGATERCELRCAGLTVREGDNALRPGIAAVSAPEPVPASRTRAPRPTSASTSTAPMSFG